jgi:hypothetical protein
MKEFYSLENSREPVLKKKMLFGLPVKFVHLAWVFLFYILLFFAISFILQGS